MNGRRKTAVLAGAILAGTASWLILPQLASGAVIFNDTFTGNPAGGTRALVNNVNQTAVINTTTPVADAEYLKTTVNAGVATFGTGVNTYTPTSASNSWNTLVGSDVVVGANHFLNLNGGFDIFFHPNTTETPTTNNTSWFRPVDVNGRVGTGAGATGMRLIFSGINPNRLDLEVAGPGSTTYFQAPTATSSAFTAFGAANGLGFGAMGGNNTAVTIANGSTFHYGFTFSTNQSTGEIDVKVFGVAGNGAIDTTTSTNLLWEKFFYGNGAALSNNGAAAVLPTGAWTWNVSSSVNPFLATDVDWDGYRIQSGTVTSFDGAIPEPASLGLLGLGCLLAIRRGRQ